MMINNRMIMMMMMINPNISLVQQKSFHILLEANSCYLRCRSNLRYFVFPSVRKLFYFNRSFNFELCSFSTNCNSNVAILYFIISFNHFKFIHSNYNHLNCLLITKQWKFSWINLLQLYYNYLWKNIIINSQYLIPFYTNSGILLKNYYQLLFANLIYFFRYKFTHILSRIIDNFYHILRDIQRNIHYLLLSTVHSFLKYYHHRSAFSFTQTSLLSNLSSYQYFQCQNCSNPCYCYCTTNITTPTTTTSTATTITTTTTTATTITNPPTTTITPATTTTATTTSSATSISTSKNSTNIVKSLIASISISVVKIINPIIQLLFNKRLNFLKQKM
ncbi:unnamed protein product, partial [Brugia timori]|uniref:Uncharacterized protein n=1 Tax=Brugia timori TaxID=42155 RepID=A0A0R3RAJ7_9BILA